MKKIFGVLATFVAIIAILIIGGEPTQGISLTQYVLVKLTALIVFITIIYIANKNDKRGSN